MAYEQRPDDDDNPFTQAGFQPPTIKRLLEQLELRSALAPVNDTLRERAANPYPLAIGGNRVWYEGPVQFLAEREGDWYPLTRLPEEEVARRNGVFILEVLAVPDDTPEDMPVHEVVAVLGEPRTPDLSGISVHPGQINAITEALNLAPFLLPPDELDVDTSRFGILGLR